MRELIQPALLSGARLALFFALVSWGVHSRSAKVWLHWDVPPIRGLPAGAAVLVNSEGLYCRQYGKAGFHGIGGFLTEDTSTPDATVFDAFGVSVVDEAADRQIIIRHWLIVTIFALLNILLMWIYRKQPEITDE